VSKLTEKQKRFVEEYLIDLNATQAAIRAGYSPQTATEQGARLLINVKVKNEVAKATALRSRRTGVNADRVILELAKIAFLFFFDVIDMGDATIVGGADRDDTAAIASVKVKSIPTEEGAILEREVKTYDKIKALELLGKHLHMWNKSETDKDTIELVSNVLSEVKKQSEEINTQAGTGRW
jgi:phage terminase small subunit